MVFLLEDMGGKRLLPLDLVEEGKSLLDNSCFDESEKGETGDRSIFSFLFIDVAKLEVEITVPWDHKYVIYY